MQFSLGELIIKPVIYCTSFSAKEARKREESGPREPNAHDHEPLGQQRPHRARIPGRDPVAQHYQVRPDSSAEAGEERGGDRLGSVLIL